MPYTKIERQARLFHLNYHMSITFKSLLYVFRLDKCFLIRPFASEKSIWVCDFVQFIQYTKMFNKLYPINLNVTVQSYQICLYRTSCEFTSDKLNFHIVSSDLLSWSQPSTFLCTMSFRGYFIIRQNGLSLQPFLLCCLCVMRWYMIIF